MSLCAPKYVWSTTDGRSFDGPTALASYIGVSTGAVCNAAREAKERESDTFSCGGQACFRRQLVTESPRDQDTISLCVQYLLSLMPVMQAHGHLQAAAHRLYPGRKLKIPTLSVHQIASIRTWTPRSGTETSNAVDSIKFDLAQLWSLHSPCSYATQYGFRRALLGEPQEKPVAELRKYPSLSFFTHEQLTKPSVALSSEDILKFMLSDFARKGHFDEIFETELPPQSQSWINELPLASNLPVATDLPSADNMPLSTDLPSADDVPLATKIPRTPPPSPRKVFSFASLAHMRELEQNIDSGANFLDAMGDTSDASRNKRRRLALTTACNITKVLHLFFRCPPEAVRCFSGALLDAVRSDATEPCTRPRYPSSKTFCYGHHFTSRLT
jgi:hypothetical protein